jgi:hypothetical protein
MTACEMLAGVGQGLGVGGGKGHLPQLERQYLYGRCEPPA